jgi:uncharacterized protein
MQETIQKLLALQNHDRLISEATADWESIGPRREAVKAQALHAQQKLEKEKFRLRAAEARRKELELEVESKKSLAQRYAQQQLETRNNEEYRALANQIRTVEEDVSRLDDLQLQSMEEIDAARKELTEFEKNFQASIESFKQQLVELDVREKELDKSLDGLENERDLLTEGIDEESLNKYERLFDKKGPTSIVGVHRNVCGGCHMQVTTQEVVSSKAGSELITCTKCGRMLYYSPEMEVDV